MFSFVSVFGTEVALVLICLKTNDHFNQYQTKIYWLSSVEQLKMCLGEKQLSYSHPRSLHYIFQKCYNELRYSYDTSKFAESTYVSLSKLAYRDKL